VTGDGEQVIKEFISAADGGFSVAVAPGDYIIRPALGASMLPRCIPSGAIRVVANQFTEVNVMCDGGIR
jgi:hypothetical protein